MRLATKLSGIVAIGGVAALAAGLISSGGIGAAFTDSATATAKINVGDFGCQIAQATPPTPGVTISADGSTASVDLGTITRSDASQRSAQIKVVNTGTIPAVATWTTELTGNLTSNFSAIPATTIPLGATDGENMNIGLKWDTLSMTDLKRAGAAVYHLTCNEASTFGQDWLVAKDSNGVSVTDNADYFTTWTNGTTPGITMHQAGAGTGLGMQASVVKLLDVAEGSALPLTEPTFSTTDGSQEVRMSIKITNGTTTAYIVRYPEAWTSPANWGNFKSLLTGYTGSDTWADMAAYANSHGFTVIKAFLIADAPAGVNQTVTCIDYSGTPLFGNC